MIRSLGWVVVVVVVVAAAGAHADEGLAAACATARERQRFATVTIDPAERAPQELPSSSTIRDCLGRDPASPFSLQVQLRARPFDSSVALTVLRPNAVAPLTLSSTIDAPDRLTEALARVLGELNTRSDVFVDQTPEDRALCDRLTTSKASLVLLLNDFYLRDDDSVSPVRPGIPMGSTTLSEAIRKHCIVVADGRAGSLPDVVARFGPLAVRGDITVRDSSPPNQHGDPRRSRGAIDGNVLRGMHSYSVVISFDLVDITTQRRLLKATRQVQLLGTSPESALKSDKLVTLSNDLARTIAKAVLDDVAAADATAAPGR